MGRKSAQNLIEAIQNNKTPALADFLFALGIHHVGKHLAEILTEQFASLEALQQATPEALQAVAGIGERLLSAWCAIFQTPSIRPDRGLRQEGVVPVRQPACQRSEMPSGSRKRVVFTGTLASMTRQEASRKVIALGAATSDRVSRKTDLVVAGKDAGSKLEKARKLGIMVLSEKPS